MDYHTPTDSVFTTTGSFRCGMDYHAPTDCDTIKKWLTKCADDSETANYISAHTKDVSVGLNNVILHNLHCIVFYYISAHIKSYIRIYFQCSV